MPPPVAIAPGLLPSRSMVRTRTSLAPDAREVKTIPVPIGQHLRLVLHTRIARQLFRGWLPSLFAIQMSQLPCVVAL